MTDSGVARPPSIRDVARLAGVSHQTVSRVINSAASIRPETRDRVLDAMARLQYRPNRAARALGLQRSDTLGVLAMQRSHYGPSRAIQAIEEAARQHGVLLTTASVASADRQELHDALEHLISQDIEGLIVIAPQKRAYEMIAELAPTLPTVDLRSGSDAGSDVSPPVDLQGAKLATRHLLDLGHRSVRHLAGPRDWLEADARMQGFLTALSEHDVPATVPVLGDWTADFGYRAGLELLPWRDVTAYFCANDAMALGLLHAARHLGIDVPGDVSVIGFDDVPEAAHFAPPLTTIAVDVAELGRRAVGCLLGDREEPTRTAPRLVVRESTAAPAR